ncbi:hypothetical protein [Ktedonospora formicarum]|uniref:Uncharacterized protein n=1 Tax=Ktedonospora formicarum TaxID=2778364 RepID=A0A8J3HY61_9CHLR|nr:hypothetical protein [Ktedonospora formicarum]GHO43148.1 hypothetical protein KSX_13110 [Ktedonospora formicarum]
MAKRSATARRNAQRQKTARTKGFELVLPETEESEEESSLAETEATAEAEQEEQLAVASETESEDVDAEEVDKPIIEEKKTRSKKATTATKAETKEVEPEIAPATGSARARLATSRQNKARGQRAAAQMITVEHFTYVKRDLITIAVLATFLFAVIIFLYVAYGSVL